MITTTYGYKVPEDREAGRIVFDALEHNIRRADSHDHDGVNSPKLPSSAITKGTVTMTVSNWVEVPDIGYKQTLTYPGTYTVANSVIQFRVKSGALQNTIVHPTVNPLSVTQVEVIMNAPLELEVLFS